MSSDRQEYSPLLEASVAVKMRVSEFTDRMSTCGSSVSGTPFCSQIRRSLGSAPTHERLRGADTGRIRVLLYGTEMGMGRSSDMTGYY